MHVTSPVGRYSATMIVLHWSMAMCLIAMLSSGLLMTSGWLDKSFTFTLYQWHKSLGVLLLFAVVLRIVVRLLTPSPALPPALPERARKLARLGHGAMYLCMLVMPLTGWIMVSASVYGLPTIVFGLFTWPHIAFLAANSQAEHIARDTHAYAAYAFILLIIVHIAAVIWHAFTEKLWLLERMGITRPSDPTGSI